LVVLPSDKLRVAAIDIGTNSILLTIAEWNGGNPKVLLDRATITRLGAGVDRNRRLSPDAITCSLNCLRDYDSLIRLHGVTLVDAVGTSVLRDARESGAFLASAQAILGVIPRIVDGLEEARLTCIGALSGESAPGPFVVFDVGGGSTEVITGDWTASGVVPRDHISLDIGCVRLTERFVASDPPSSETISTIRSAVQTALARIPFDASRGMVVGVGGTVTTLAAVELGLREYDAARVHGSTLELGTVRKRRERLCMLNRNERAQVAGLSVGRADVIIAGALIVEQFLEFLGRDSVAVSDQGVRHGLLRELFRRAGVAARGLNT